MNTSVFILFVRMYLYAFSQYAGFDRVFYCQEKNLNAKAGDLLQQGSDFFLVLGEEVSFSELYTLVYTGKTDFKLVYSQLLCPPTLHLVHRMVYERYTSYKKVLPLFLDPDIEKLLMKQEKSSPKKTKTTKTDLLLGKTPLQAEEDEQILIIFPDMWTLKNLLDHQEDQVLILSSLDSQSRKNKNWRNIKIGSEKLICTTGSELFQDFQHLKKIYLLEPQKWYYASQQDPRYKVESVVKKMSTLYNAELIVIESEML